MPTVGVIAIQGDFAKHIEALQRLNRSDLEIIEVRTPEELALVDRVIIPGGESTTVGMLMHRFGVGTAIIDRVQRGMPVWGTCMGMIVMAREVDGRANQYTLGLLDVSVERNAFGRQVHSFEDEVSISGIDSPVMGV